MSNFIQVTPFMHVEDLERAVNFFTDILGFETRLRTADYAYVHRETAGFRILEQKGADGAPPRQSALRVLYRRSRRGSALR